MLFESLIGLKCDKHTGPWLAFNGEWFDRHQRKLLWLLNAPLIKHWFRWCLRIRRCDAATEKPIVKIRSNAYHVPGPEPGQFVGEYRTHPKFSKRLYFAFRPLWWAMHAWDVLIADQFAPWLAFGFATLTVYPDPDPELRTFDGYLAYGTGGESWSALRNGAVVSTNDSATSHYGFSISSGSGSNTWDSLVRSELLFYTGPGQLSIVSGTVSLSPFVAKNDSLSILPNVCIYESFPSSQTSASMTDTIGTIECSSPIEFSALISGYNDFTLNEYGRSVITQMAQFGMRNANYDVADVAPTWSASASSYWQTVAADTGGTGQDPKLTITYFTANRMNPVNPLRPAAFSPGMAR